MKKTVAVLGLVIVLAVIAIVQQFATAEMTALPTEEKPQIGYLAPSFELDTLEGGTLGISRGEREKAVILNFWASWCDPCRLEAPFLVDIYDKYNEELEIYAVNGTEYDKMAGIEAFVKQYQYKFPVLLDRKSEVFNRYEVPGYPTSVFIDRNGVIQDIVIGLPGHEEFEKRVSKLIRS